MSKIYAVYAIKRFGWVEGIKRTICHIKFIFSYEIPYSIETFKKRDRRKKAWGLTKWAINRDGDFFLVECPKCHTQHVSYLKSRKLFECYKCKIIFSVYREDGVVKIIDHRKGNIKDFPRTSYRDIYPDSFHRLGIEGDAPWWWRKKAVYRDLHDGMDAHRHKPYKIIEQTKEIDESSPQTQDTVG